MSSREQFESWVSDNGKFQRALERKGGIYLLATINTQWEAWQAASKASEQQLAAVVAENAGLKSSRAVLSENALESCNAIASAGFRHEAIMRGLYASTGNGNKYHKPISTLVDEALREVKTPATDEFLAEVRAQGVDMFAAVLRRKGDDAFFDAIAEAQANAADQFAAQLRQGAEHE